jgi:hypothetical protein
MQAEGVEGRYVIDFEPGIKVEEKGELCVTVTLQEAGIFNHVAVQSLLDSFSNYALYIVQLLENV